MGAVRFGDVHCW